MPKKITTQKPVYFEQDTLQIVQSIMDAKQWSLNKAVNNIIKEYGAIKQITIQQDIEAAK